MPALWDEAGVVTRAAEDVHEHEHGEHDHHEHHEHRDMDPAVRGPILRRSLRLEYFSLIWNFLEPS